MLSVTDHNEITNVAAVFAAAEGTALLVVSGVELSTRPVHLLAYLPTLPALQQLPAHGGGASMPSPGVASNTIDAEPTVQGAMQFRVVAHGNRIP